jgi:hypothetical protein
MPDHNNIKAREAIIAVGMLACVGCVIMGIYHLFFAKGAEATQLGIACLVVGILVPSFFVTKAPSDKDSTGGKK